MLKIPFEVKLSDLNEASKKILGKDSVITSGSDGYCVWYEVYKKDSKNKENEFQCKLYISETDRQYGDKQFLVERLNHSIQSWQNTKEGKEFTQ